MKTTTSWEHHQKLAEQALRDEKRAQAIEHLQNALKESEEWDSADERTIKTLEMLCECLWFEGKFVEAVPLSQQLVLVYKSVVGDDHIATARATGNLAMLHHARENYAEAKTFYKRSIDIKRTVLGNDHAEVKRLESVYADLLAKMEKARKENASMPTARMWTRPGESVAEESAAIVHRMDETTTLNPEKEWQKHKTNAEDSTRENEFAKATAAFMQAVIVAERFGKKDYRLCWSLENLAGSLQKQELHHKAEPYLKRSLEIRKEILGPTHVSVARALDALARTAYYQSAYDKAEQYADQSLKLYRSLLGEQHADYATALANLAMLYHVQRQYDKAEPFYTKALSIRTKALGSDHPDTLKILQGYAEVLRATHREAEAEHLDTCAKGLITGSWKTVSVPQDQQLGKAKENCVFCGGKLEGKDKCGVCGTKVES